MSLQGQLSGWQRREWLYRTVWAAARLAAVVVVGLTAACALDWWIDRSRDTPFWVRALMSATQLVVYAYAAVMLLLRLRVPSLDDLALKAEQSFPEFGHRLVTALQLNRTGAKTAGMSQQLIEAVTAEAETLSAQKRLASLAESNRFVRGLALLAPVALFALGMFALNPTLVAALLARQALLPVDIPRPVEVTNVTNELWPSGDEVELRFEVTGPVSEDATGVAVVRPDDQPEESFPLSLVAPPADGKSVFTATLPPSSTPFEVRARAAGGRTRRPTRIDFAARPVVTEVNAWVEMPAFVDPEGKRRYERFQSQGEVYAYPGSAVRVEAVASKPVRSGAVVVYSRDDKGTEAEAFRVPLELAADRTRGTVRFDLPAKPSAYRVEVADEHGFANLNPPRRGITLAPDEPPRVSLLQEVLKDPQEEGPLDDFEVNGMPLAVGGQVQAGYSAKSPLGLARAVLVYRVNDGPWTPLPLSLTTADPKLGKFLPDLGVFEGSGVYGQVEFYPVPAANPDVDPPGLEGGGRYNFQTAALKKKAEDGTESKLEPGDRVEYYVEVYDRNPAPGRQPGRSESRIKAVVTEGQLKAWLDQRDQSRERLRQIEERQRGVFGRKGT